MTATETVSIPVAKVNTRPPGTWPIWVEWLCLPMLILVMGAVFVLTVVMAGLEVLCAVLSRILGLQRRTI